MIVIDDVLLEVFRRKKRCEWCGAATPRCQPHHYHCRGMGGGSRLDIAENLIALCEQCHLDAHSLRISRLDILEKIALRMGMTAEGCQKVIWDTLSRKKP